MSNSETKFFYYDRINQKIGPVTEQQLKELAAQGVIGPNTPIETGGGHKGLAGQIPGMVFKTPVPQPVSVSKWIKPAVIAGIAVAVIVSLVMFVPQIIPSGSSNMLKSLRNAKQGDWVRYDVETRENDRTYKEKESLLIDVVSNDGKKIKLKVSDPKDSSAFRNSPFAEAIEIDLSNANSPEKILAWLNQCPITVNGKKLIQIKKGKSVKETIQVAETSFNCVIAHITATLTGSNGETFTIIVKLWESKTAPVGGLVKAEWEARMISKTSTETRSVTVTLANFNQ